jgi:mono/diheme cytochrome c family protein
VSGRSRAATRWATRASCVSVAGLALAGCGGGTPVSRGHAIFTQQCSSCHTLTGRETDVDGGDLAIARMSVADLVSFARVMPLRHPLSRTDALAVARYVHTRAAAR